MLCAIKDDTRTGETPGPIPTAELEDPTGAQCSFCLRPVQGAPDYCCEVSRLRSLKINAGEHPIFPVPANDQDDE